jgi:hypothetical protein
MRRKSTMDGLGGGGARSRGAEEHLAHDFGHMPRLPRDLVPCEADDLPTGEGQELVAPAVALEGLPRAVCAEPVDLHNDTMLTPEEVDLHLLALHGHPHIHLRRRQTVALAEPKEALLQLAARDALFRVSDLENPAQSPNTGSAIATSKELAHGSHVKDTQHLRLVAHPLEGTPMQQPGQIQQSSRNGCARDPINRRPIDGSQAGRAMDPDPRPREAGAAGNGDVDPGLGGRHKALQGGCRPVGEDRPRPHAIIAASQLPWVDSSGRPSA